MDSMKQPGPKDHKSLLCRMAHAIQWFASTAGGVGQSPIAPGTAGSAVGLALYLGIVALSGSALAIIPVIILFGLIGAWLGNWAQVAWGRLDPKEFVLDEVVGMWVAMIGIGGDLPLTWPTVLAAFALFRFFDIVKPWPASRLDRIPNGWGIVCDDIAAGIYANIALRLGIAALHWLR
jgi:phosphatidylglycerophosphatase A